MKIGAAIEEMIKGRKVMRKGWNGRGMFLYYVPAAKYAAKTKAAREHYGATATVPYKSYVALKCVDDEVVPWQASQTDLLADDYVVLP